MSGLGLGLGLAGHPPVTKLLPTRRVHAVPRMRQLRVRVRVRVRMLFPCITLGTSPARSLLFADAACVLSPLRHTAPRR